MEVIEFKIIHKRVFEIPIAEQKQETSNEQNRWIFS